MIEINLVPQNVRKKKRGQLLGGIKIPLEVIIGSIGGLVMLLIMVHVSFLLVNIYKLNQHRALKKQWDVILPAKESVDKVIKDMRELQAKQKAINKITRGDRILWAQKLNLLSDNLDRGVWFTRIRLKENVFFIEGSAISKQSEQIMGVHSFTANLKNDKVFLDKFSNIELGSIQRRYINKTEIADFLITAEMEEEDLDVE